MSHTYTTPAQDAARIRKTLKAAKIGNSRQISVRAKSYSLGSSLNIEINDPAVDIREVMTIAASSERVQYDSATGEVLCGGNRHLFVRYSDAAAEAFAASNADALAKMMNGNNEDWTEVDGKRFRLCRSEVYSGDMELERVDECGKRHWLPRREYLNAVTLSAAILYQRG